MVGELGQREGGGWIGPLKSLAPDREHRGWRFLAARYKLGRGTFDRDIDKPVVIDSRLISRRGNDFKIYLRLLKKKLLTVVPGYRS